MDINIPENINEITVGQYQQFEKANVEGAEEDFIIHKMINIFCGVPMKETLNIKVEDAEAISSDLAEVLVQETELQRVIDFKGKKWGLIPNLQDITLGEYIDLEEGLKDTQTLHKAMAVLYRPVTKSYKELYSIEKYEGSSKYSDTMKDLPLGIASAAVVFFYHLSNALAKASPASFLSMTEKSKMTSAQKEYFPKNGDGLRVYTRWLMETLPSIMK